MELNKGYQQFLKEFKGALEKEEKQENKQQITSLKIKQELYNNKTFYITIGEIDRIKTVSILNNQAVIYAITKKDNFI